MRLGHDGETGWVRRDGPAEPAVFRPCPGEDPTTAGRVDAIGETGPGTPLEAHLPPGTLFEQLILFRDEASAVAAMAALEADKDRCGWSTAMVDWVEGYDSDVFLTSRYIDDNGKAALLDGAAGYEEAIVLRRGNALWIRFQRMHGVGSGGYDGGSVNVRDELCTIMRRCYPPASASPQPS